MTFHRDTVINFHKIYLKNVNLKASQILDLVSSSLEMKLRRFHLSLSILEAVVDSLVRQIFLKNRKKDKDIETIKSYVLLLQTRVKVPVLGHKLGKILPVLHFSINPNLSMVNRWTILGNLIS